MRAVGDEGMAPIDPVGDNPFRGDQGDPFMQPEKVEAELARLLAQREEERPTVTGIEDVNILLDLFEKSEELSEG